MKTKNKPLDEYDGKMDKEIIPLCDAINTLPGLETVQSCYGHEKFPMRIFFAFKGKSMNRSLESLGMLHYSIRHYDNKDCHLKRWRIEAQSDCAAMPAYFMIESITTGIEAYKDSLKIAKMLKNANK